MYGPSIFMKTKTERIIIYSPTAIIPFFYWIPIIRTMARLPTVSVTAILGVLGEAEP
jgi:hypothetical protein